MQGHEAVSELEPPLEEHVHFGRGGSGRLLRRGRHGRPGRSQGRQHREGLVEAPQLRDAESRPRLLRILAHLGASEDASSPAADAAMGRAGGAEACAAAFDFLLTLRPELPTLGAAHELMVLERAILRLQSHVCGGAVLFRAPSSGFFAEEGSHASKAAPSFGATNPLRSSAVDAAGSARGTHASKNRSAGSGSVASHRFASAARAG